MPLCPVFYVFFLLSVNRRGHDVLRDQLPSKQEHVILVRLSPIQRALYTEFMKRFREAGNTGWLGLNPLKAFCVCCKVRLVYIHPSSNHFFPYGVILLLWRLIKHYLIKYIFVFSSRSGITQMFSTKLCRKRIRQMNRTWTWMTSLQLVTPDAPHLVLDSKPK